MERKDDDVVKNLDVLLDSIPGSSSVVDNKSEMNSTNLSENQKKVRM